MSPTNAADNSTPSVATIGEPIVAVLPDGPVPFGLDIACRPYPGGAEANVAVGLARLGFGVHFVGRIGDDPFGRLVAADFAAEGVHTDGLMVDPERSTACYLREWLPDGHRRPTYYRTCSAGSALSPDDWRAPEPLPALLHVTGITPALSPTAGAAIATAIAWAHDAGVPVSVDPNHRPWLWPDDRARPALRTLVAAADIVLMSEEDRDLLFPGATDTEALRLALELGAHRAVLKLGLRGAIGVDSDNEVNAVNVAAEPASRSVDPVGAGDGFDAGFLAGHLLGWCLSDCMRLGAVVGARAVARPGDHTSYPHLTDLPADLARQLTSHRGVR